MNIFKKKPSSVLFLFLILFFTVVAVHADSGRQSLFTGSSDLFDGNNLYGLNDLPAVEKINLMNDRPQVSDGKIVLEILAGIGGNIALGVGSAFLLGNIISGDSENLIASGAVIGFSTGGAGGSALGVYLVGNSGNTRGKFGKALLGGFLGEIVSLGILLISTKNQLESEGLGVGFLAMAILPPIGATIMFNSSLRYRSLPEGNRLFNLHKDKLTLGIPDMQIRPLAAYGKNMKAEFGFKINVLSVVL